jgi:hypothetical protein
LSENGHLTILNAQKKREVIGSSQKKYSVDHETSPLSDTKIPKAKPIIKFMETCFKNNPK